MNITASLIASLIRCNTDIYLSGYRSREEWSAEQMRLWTLAASKRCSKAVLRLVMPSLSTDMERIHAMQPVPSYAVRKQLRETTLKVGR